MQIKKLEKDGYNLHLIKNTDFKTVLVKMFFWNKIKEDEITYRNVLFNNLLFSSFKYKTPREMAIKKADLYGLNIISNITRRSNYIFNDISMSVIDDKYTEKGLLKESLLFLFDILQNPNVNNKKFDKESFLNNKNIVLSNIKRELEDPNSFAIKNYKKLLNSANPYSCSLFGKESELESITPGSLHEFYTSFFKNNNLDIAIIGDINFNEIESIFDKYFELKGTKKFESDLYLNYEKELTEKHISSNFNQSKLVMGGSTKSLTIFEKKYTSLIYNIILGSSPRSKLFQNVRERNSFAYSINSSFNRLDGTFLIYAGISKDNFENTKEEINKQILEMKKGNFTESEVENAKTFIITVIEETDDYQGAILDRYFSNMYLDTDSKEKQIECVKSITKKDIINLANKIEIDTILLVEEKI